MKNETGKISNMRQKTHDGVDNIMDKAESVGERGKEEMNHLKEKALMVRKNVDVYIQKNPERSVLFATGAGIILGGILVAILMRKKN